MGNYRFRLSDMIPNAWFYKLRDMSSKPKNTKKKPTSTIPSVAPAQKSHLSQATRYSYYITAQPNRADNFCNNSPQHPKASDTHFPELPRRSSTRKPKRKAVYKPSPNKTTPTSPVINCNFHDRSDSTWTDGTNPIQYSPDYFGFSSESSSDEYADFHELIPSEFECDHLCGLSTCDSMIDIKDEGSTKKIHDQELQGLHEFDMISEMELPPILTKPMKFDDDHVLSNEATTTEFKRSSSNFKEVKGQRSLTVKIVKEESIRTQKGSRKKANPNSVRKSSANSSGIRLRSNTPRIAAKSRTQPCGKKTTCLKPKNRHLSESFAVAKSSVDPLRDFRESMVEMIVENNIRASKDLEDLLACYLELNLNEYHDLIIKAFEQIWFDMANIKM